MITILILYLLLIPCTAAFIRAKHNENAALALIWKAASTETILLAGICFTWGASDHASAYAALITAGIALGLAGDMAICVKFIGGMIFFALGHLAYISAAFQVTTHLLWAVPVFILLFIVILILYLTNKHQLDFGRLWVPAVLYCIVILSMVSLSATAAFSRTPGGIILLIGAVLFAASDTMLALNQFHKRFHAGILNADRFNHRPESNDLHHQKMDAVSLVCYYVGQSFFAISIFLM